MVPPRPDPPPSRGTVTIIVTVYNRRETVGRTLRSILAQTYPHLDIIVVDDGSTDDSLAVVRSFPDPRIRVFVHERNLGVTAAKNTGLENIKGDWFTFVDSDDELVPEAIDTLLSVLERDPLLTHIECNCTDAATGRLTGEGLDADQPLDEATIVGKMKHDHWGILHTTLLRGNRFNPRVPGYETILWTKVRQGSRGYYLHRGLNIVHHEGAGRVTRKRRSIAEIAAIHAELLREEDWLESLKAYNPDEHLAVCREGYLNTAAVGDRRSAQKYAARLEGHEKSLRDRASGAIVGLSGKYGARALLFAARAVSALKRRVAGR